LSGGLDSRAVLACVENKDQTFAFCCYNEPNRELAVAEAIACSLKIPFFAWQRPFEYYGDTAEMGVRISGGMGTFANNHFLGTVGHLRREGAQNLLTGCYCDYLFKGLPLNCKKHWLTGREELGPFKHDFYFGHHPSSSPFSAKIQRRLESRVPAEYQAQESDAAVFEVEARRTFPFFSEGDNQQRLVPQRVTGWYLPMADRDILEVYRKIPWRYKLNRSVYSKAVRKLCGGPLARIPDANTGVRPGASALAETLSNNWIRLRRKLQHHKQSIGTDGSWPDWQYYVCHSATLRALWKRPNSQATDIFRSVLGADAVRPDTADYLNGEVFLLVPMLSLKLWLEQWHG
jgi:asparagine synthase (glutamine-hydrolysing)